MPNSNTPIKQEMEQLKDLLSENYISKNYSDSILNTLIKDITTLRGDKNTQQAIQTLISIVKKKDLEKLEVVIRVSKESILPDHVLNLSTTLQFFITYQEDLRILPQELVHFAISYLNWSPDGTTPQDEKELTADNIPPLFIAAVNDDSEVTETLLKNGANPYIRRGNETAFTNALAKIDFSSTLTLNDEKIIKSFLEAQTRLLSDTEKQTLGKFLVGMNPSHDLYFFSIRYLEHLLTLPKYENIEQRDKILKWFESKHIMPENSHTLLSTAIATQHFSITNPLLEQEELPFYLKELSIHGLEFLETTFSDGDRDIIELHDKYGRTAFHFFALYGNNNDLKSLIKKGINIDQKTSQNNTALHMAAISGKTDCLQTLLETGADYNITNTQGKTPLELAVESGHDDCVKALLKTGANYNRINQDGYTLLDLAAKKGHAACVKTLLSENKKVAEQYDTTNTELENTLFLAVDSGHADCVKALLDIGIGHNSINEDQDTPLHLAAYKGHTDCVITLLEARANYNSINQDKNTPLHFAAKNGHTDCIITLLEAGANYNSINQDKNTPLHFAAKNGHTDCVQALLDVDYNKENKDGKTALHFAAEQGDLESLVLLLKSKKMKLDTQDDNGNTALHHAVNNSHADCVKALLEAEADCQIRNKNDRTPLDIAVSLSNIRAKPYTLMPNILSQHAAIVDTLSQNAATITAQNKQGNTSLHLAVKNTWYDTNYAKILLLNKVEVDTRNKEGNTPLHFAVNNTSKNYVDVLLRNKAEVSARNQEDNTPLHFAVNNISTNYVDTLLLNKAEVNTQNSEGDTPLHNAAKLTNRTTAMTYAQTLLKHKAWPDVKNHAGKTPMDYFSKSEKKELENAVRENIKARKEQLSTDALHFYKSLSAVDNTTLIAKLAHSPKKKPILSDLLKNQSKDTKQIWESLVHQSTSKSAIESSTLSSIFWHIAFKVFSIHTIKAFFPNKLEVKACSMLTARAQFEALSQQENSRTRKASTVRPVNRSRGFFAHKKTDTNKESSAPCTSTPFKKA